MVNQQEGVTSCVGSLVMFFVVVVVVVPPFHPQPISFRFGANVGTLSATETIDDGPTLHEGC